MKPSRLFVALALFIFSGVLHAAPAGDALMRAMLKAEDSVSYSATETITRAGAPTMVAKIKKQGRKKRAEYSAPAIMRGDVRVSDGKIVWRFHKAENSAVKTQAASRNGSRGDWLQRVTAKNSGATQLSGRKAWLVIISPRGKKQTTRKIWIDDKTKIRLRSERYDGNGKRLETWSLSNLKIEKIPDAVFQYQPPRGASVTNAGVLYSRLNHAQRNVSWLQVPHSLPAGYAFESAVVDEKKGESWLRYSNGARRFSIFQQRTADKKSTPLKRAGNGWYWQKSGSRFLIAGLPEAQAKRVAQSFK